MSAEHKDTKQIKKEDQKAYFAPAVLRMLFPTVLRSKVNYSACMANSGDFWKQGGSIPGCGVINMWVTSNTMVIHSCHSDIIKVVIFVAQKV